jgi:hypothetical protein
VAARPTTRLPTFGEVLQVRPSVPTNTVMDAATIALVVAAVWAAGVLFVLGACRAAARGDR